LGLAPKPDDAGAIPGLPDASARQLGGVNRDKN